jgi:hypothetical protein
MTYQALHRTCATHFQMHGKPRDIPALKAFEAGDDRALGGWAQIA